MQAIRDHASPEQWRYVDTKDNPADDTSRGLGANELIRSERWWNGPNFLWKPLPNETSFDPQVSPDDSEVRKVTVLASTSTEHSDLIDDIKHFSDWFHAKRVIALCVLFSQKMKQPQERLNQLCQRRRRLTAPKQRKKTSRWVFKVHHAKGKGSPNSRVVPD